MTVGRGWATRGSGSWTTHPIVAGLGALAAAATFFLGGMAFQAQLQSSDDDDDASGMVDQSTSSITTSTGLPTTTALRLGGEPTTRVDEESITTTESSTTVPQTVAVEPPPDWSEEGIALAWNFSYDFDETPLTVVRGSPGGVDIYWRTGEFAFTVPTGLVAVVDGEPTRSECERPQNPTTPAIAVDDIEQGHSFCFRTTEGNWVWLSVVEFDQSSPFDSNWSSVVSVWYWGSPQRSGE